MDRSTGSGGSSSPWRGRLRRPRGRHAVAVVAAVTAVPLIAAGAMALATNEHAGPQGDGTAFTSYGWRVTPAGQQTRLGERPYGVAQSPDGRTLLISNDGVHDQSLMVVDAASRQVMQTLHYPAPKALFIGVAFSPDGSRAYASAGPNNLIRAYRVQGQRLSGLADIPLRASTASQPFPAGLTVSPDSKRLLVADNLGNALSVIDVATGAERRVLLNPTTCPVSQFGFDPSNGRACNFPYTVELSTDGRTAYVSNWGKSSVSAVDTDTLRVVRDIPVGTHPSALKRNPRPGDLYVANTDSDSVSVIDTRSNSVRRTISVEPYPHAGVGSNPDALAFSPNGRTLYVGNAGDNDVAVVRLAIAGQGDRIAGLIPTGWYPTGIAVSADGNRLYAVSAKGLGAGPNPRGPRPVSNRDTPPNQYIGSMIKGLLSSVAVPSDAELDRLTARVVSNNGFDERAAVRVVGHPDQSVVPYRVGDASPLKHVIYIVNENRTYDQVLGDLHRGNGDPR